MLQSTTINDIVPQRKVYVCYDTDTLQDALKTLSAYNILSLPVLESKTKKFLGFVDMLDIVSHVVHIHEEMPENDSEIDNYSMLRYKDVQFLYQQIGQIIDLSGTNPVCNVHGESPLFECIGLFQKGVHRVAVISSYGITENILSQSDVIRFLISKLDSYLDIFEKTVRETFNIANKTIISVQSNEATIKAFKIIHDNKISAVAVVDENGKLIGNLSASDLKGAVTTDDDEGAETFGSLLLPVTTFLQQGGMSKLPVATCFLSSSLSFVLLKIMALHVHRLWIVDESEKPIGIISLTDIMQAVISQKQEDRKS